MNTQIAITLRAHLTAIRDFATAELAKLPPEPAVTPSTSAPEPKWMKLTHYARARSMSLKTLYVRISEGLPTVGEGHGRRVIVAEADAWLKTRSRGT
jgi:hypothetical protein